MQKWFYIGLALFVLAGVGVTQLTRGYRNKNPGNLRGNDSWQGLDYPPKDDAGFYRFKSDFYGLRALARTLLNYQKNHGLSTVSQIISRYAPSNENDTASYIQSVSSAIGVTPDQFLMVPTRLNELMAAIVKHENGVNKYTRDEIDAAARAA